MQLSRYSYRAIFIDLVSWFFIFLWIYAAASKLLDVQTFRVQLGQSPLLTPFAGIIAWLIPLTEILIAVMLAMPRSRLNGLYASFGLMVMFTGYIIAVTQFSEYIPCSCGGILEKMSWNQHLVFNIACVLVALTSILVYEPTDKNILLQQKQD